MLDSKSALLMTMACCSSTAASYGCYSFSASNVGNGTPLVGSADSEDNLGGEKPAEQRNLSGAPEDETRDTSNSSLQKSQEVSPSREPSPAEGQDNSSQPLPTEGAEDTTGSVVAGSDNSEESQTTRESAEPTPVEQSKSSDVPSSSEDGSVPSQDAGTTSESPKGISRSEDAQQKTSSKLKSE